MSFRDRVKNMEQRLLYGLPEGVDAWWLGRQMRSLKGTAVLIVRDDNRLHRLGELIPFFDPAVRVLTFPAWDCMPYDRVSPDGTSVAERLRTLAALREPAPQTLVLTTAQALVQRVIPREALNAHHVNLIPGMDIPQDRLVLVLGNNGYRRVDSVHEIGEFSLRGGLVDLFPTDQEMPVRLDFFGDTLESIRAFDAVTQRTTGPVASVTLLPVGEILLTPESISRFRQGYRDVFQVTGEDDPLYASISQGRPYVGQEHWLPLFYDRLETLLDHVNPLAVWTDLEVDAVAKARLDQIADHYETRRSFLESTIPGQAPYRPVPPERGYLTGEEWGDLRNRYGFTALSPFGDPLEKDVPGTLVPGFAEARAQQDHHLIEALLDRVRPPLKTKPVVIACYTLSSLERLKTMMQKADFHNLLTISAFREAKKGYVSLCLLEQEHSVETPDFYLLTEQDIFGERITRRQKKKRSAEQLLSDLGEWSLNEYVVHMAHGIGQYTGLVTLDINGAPHDCARLEYAGGDKLFVPVENLDVLTRYGAADAVVSLDKLGGAGWTARKARVKEKIRDVAEKLMELAAARSLKTLDPLGKPEGLYDEFSAQFPYAETDDQLQAIDEVLGDLASGQPMDRLICGDVGFGKTEVALRAAFVVAAMGKQVAVVTPTTLLCRQHYRNFKNRLAGFPIRVEQLSRMVPARQASQTKEDMARGRVDVVIATHTLFGKGAQFQNLGLVIIDEEQHFGVGQKERLKELAAGVHVLTLSATPIPRTLQMALSGLREMSMIATPPVDRLAVRTFVMPYDAMVIREAILRERYRNGQVFYVCPRLQDLPKVEERLRLLVPDLKIATAHGQLPPAELDKVMEDFCGGVYDVLLSTNIVESGLDIPTANTIIIHRADLFGLAQLYQLRGRVGRAKARGYAYLTTSPNKPLTATAQKRLEVMHTLDGLGAGFSLASHDMDIRGAGNIVGDEQSGHIKEVGISLYQHLLEEAVMAIKMRGAETMPVDLSPQINLGLSVLIPEDYVADLNLRLTLYRRLSAFTRQEDVEDFQDELVDRFGPLPVEVTHLLAIIRLKILCKAAGIERVDAGAKGAVISFHDNRFPNPLGLVTYMQTQRDVKLRPDHKFVMTRPWGDVAARLAGVGSLVNDLHAIALRGEETA